MDGSQPSHPQRSDAECDEGSDWSLHNNSRSTTSWNGNLVYDGSLPFPRQQQQPQQTIHGGPAIAIVPMPPQAGQFQEPNWPPPCTANMSTQQDFYIHHPGAVVGLNTWAPLSPEDLDGMLAPEDLDGMLAPANFMPSVPVTPNRKLPREGWTQEQQNMLIKARQAGLGFTEISAKMRVKHGVEISPNALVKRFQKVQGHYLGPLPEAIKNIMPEIVARIRAEVERINPDTLTEAEKQAQEEIMRDLPQSFPKTVQNQIYRKYKSMQPPPSSPGD